MRKGMLRTVSYTSKLTLSEVCMLSSHTCDLSVLAALAPSAGTYPTTPTGAIAPQISLDRERERERERERDREERERERDRDRDRDRDRERERDTLPPVALNPIASARATPTSQPSTPPMILSEIDPETVPRELKKEGPGWSAIWNPKVKKHLDLTALHTLRHVR